MRNADSLRNIAFLLSQNLSQDAVLIALLSVQKGQVYQYFFMIYAWIWCIATAMFLNMKNVWMSG